MPTANSSQMLLANKPHCLRITEEQFDELYPDMKGKYDWFNNPPPPGISKEHFEKTYLRSKLWRLNNLYKVVDKDGELVLFRMNYAQHVVYAASRKHGRVIILKSRQQGISTFWLVSIFDDAIVCPYLTCGLMAQGTDEASTLLRRTKLLVQNLNPAVAAFFNVRITNDNSKEISFANKSTIFIRVSFRSATLQRLHISEYGKIANAFPQRARETKTGTLQAIKAGNTAVIESTAEGMNDFKDLWDAAELAQASGEFAPKDFYPVFLSWLDDPDCVLDIKQADTKESREYFEQLETEHRIVPSQEQKNFWIAQYRELGEDIHQEYPATPEEAFTASRDGTYWSTIFRNEVVMKNGLKKGLYDRNLPVYVFFDLGVDDYYVLFFVQYDPYREKYMLIHEFFDNGMWLGFYLDYIFTEWQGRVDYLVYPHDIKVREQGAQGAGNKANSRVKIVREHMKKNEYKANVKVLKRMNEAEGIEAVKKIIPQLEVDTECRYGIDVLKKFSKEWDEKLKVWKKKPKEDQYIHGADVMRYIAQTFLFKSPFNKSDLDVDASYKAKQKRGFDV